MEPSLSKHTHSPYILSLISCVSLLCATHIFPYPLLDLVGILAFAVFAATYGLLLATADVRFTPLPPVLCIMSLVGRGLWSGFTHDIAMSFVSLVLCSLAALIIYLCHCKRTALAPCFVAINVLSCAFLMLELLFFLSEIYGSFRFENIGRLLEDITTSLSTLVQTAGVTELTDETLVQLQDSLLSRMLTSLPAVLVCWSMVSAALCMYLYKKTVHIFHYEPECLSIRSYRFRLDTISIAMFYLLYAAYFITSFLCPDTPVNVALLNASTILTYPFAYIGIRSLHARLLHKLKSRAGTALCIFLCLMLFLIFGLLGIVVMLLSFIGAAAQMRENRLNTSIDR